MRSSIITFILAAGISAAPALAQTAQLPAPSPIEKELAARASGVTEVTLGKNMLAFAAKIMNGKNDDDAEARHLIEGLDGIYVRQRKTGESTDVMVKLVNGESHGMFILDAGPRELTIVLILGPIHTDDLSRLRVIGGLDVLGDISRDVDGKDKDKTKDKKGAGK